LMGSTFITSIFLFENLRFKTPVKLIFTDPGSNVIEYFLPFGNMFPFTINQDCFIQPVIHSWQGFVCQVSFTMPDKFKHDVIRL